MTGEFLGGDRVFGNCPHHEVSLEEAARKRQRFDHQSRFDEQERGLKVRQCSREELRHGELPAGLGKR
jgi:hypothetical protein